MTDRAERLIEVYVGQGESQGGTWYVTDVHVPVELSREDAEEFALERVQSWLDATEDIIAFIGVYCYWSDDMMLEFWKEEEEI